MTEKKPTIEQAVREILREAARPMTTAEIAAELATRVTLKAKDPRSSVRGVLNYDSVCVAIDRGTYVYTRTAVNGAAVRDRLRLVSVKGGYCAVGAELIGVLWPGFSYEEPRRAPRLALAGGPAVEVSWPREQGVEGQIRGPYGTLRLPPPFWEWWSARTQEGADEIVVRCDDGEAGRYTVEAIRREDVDPDAVAAATDAARTAAHDALRGADRGVSFEMLVLRLLVRASYHQPIPPRPLADVLLAPHPAFELTDWDFIIPRPDLTPALATLFQDRLLAAWFADDRNIREELKFSPLLRPSQEELLESLSRGLSGRMLPPPEPVAPTVVQAYRLKITLQNVKRLSRTVEVREDQTLEDVHDIIQASYGWDDDHLFAFFLGGRGGHDEITQVQRGSVWTGVSRPEPDDVILREIGLRPKQSFSYLFDFGDRWWHDVTFEGSAPADGDPYPRLVASEGEAPQQYDTEDEDDEWGDGEVERDDEDDETAFV